MGQCNKHLTQRIEERLRDITCFRMICKPWKDRKLYALQQQYLQMGYGEQLKALKDTHKGERCFIIGNGPSLKAQDLDRLKNEYTFASNRIFDIFAQTDWRPWSYVVEDESFIKSDLENIMTVHSPNKFLSYKGLRDDISDVFWLFEDGGFPSNRGSDTTAYIAEDISKGVSRGYTVTFVSIQMAIYMGFTEIYLLGVDFNYSHYMDRKGKIRRVDGVQDYFSGRANGSSLLFLEPVQHAYNVAREYCDFHSIKIFNATRGGQLEVFERVDFDTLVDDQR